MDTKKNIGKRKSLINMKEILLSTLTGFGCGVVFAAFKLPVPAPPVFAGVAGIIGLWIGFTVITNIIS
jgi:XapX domain-containing protein